MKVFFVSNDRLLRAVSEQQAGITLAPAPTAGLAWWGSGEIPYNLEPLSQPRPAQSSKGFFLPALESVGSYGREASATAVEVRPMVLLGIRACELRARTYLDKVMLEGEFDDQVYAARREATTIISCDCVDVAESCFCTLVDGKPYPTEGYDLNLTAIDGGFIAEVATEKGLEWLGDSDIKQPTDEQLAKRQSLRDQAVARLQKQNTEFTFSATDELQPQLPEGDLPEWQKFASDCVECGACTHICPTCHCFYLYDQTLGPEEFERVRTWDSCLLSTYHRMAGGKNMKLTPRPSLSSRLANRVLHKFTYSPQQYQFLGCVGCGRCIDACLGAIDIRQVVQELGK